MAKGKHSTALFEVIHSARKPERVAQSLRTPKWWFKSRHSSVSQPPADPTYPDRDPTASSGEPASRPSHYDDRSSTVHMDFDPGRKEITFRLRYTTALVTAFGIFVLIGMSYVVGRHLGHGPQSASAAEPQQPSVGQLMQQPPQPSVINVAKPRPSGQSAGTAQPTHRATQPNTTTPRPQAASTLVPASAYTELPRKPGLNYALITIYPSEERSKAEAARDFLVSHGIPCTLEKTGWAPSWISLVGTAGFPKASDPDFKIYTANILKVSADMKTSNFEKPQPTGYSWKGPPTDRGL